MLRHLSKNEKECQASIDALEELGISHDNAIEQVLKITQRQLQAEGGLIYLTYRELTPFLPRNKVV